MAASSQAAGGVVVAAPQGFLMDSTSHGQELQEDRAQDNQVRNTLKMSLKNMWP